MRLLCRLNMIASSELPGPAKFITLTYPRDLLPSWEWSKRQLNAFLSAYFKRWGDCAILWRMEHQEDGAIHFHLMVFNKRYIPWWWVAREWDRLIGNQVVPEKSASTSIRAMRNWRQTQYYVSKYIAKDTDEAFWDVEHGRHWGCRHWALLPVHKVLTALGSRDGYNLRRWMRRWRLARGIKTRGLGAPLPYCHCSRAGMTLFISDRDTSRLLAGLRAAPDKLEGKGNELLLSA
jgi:hypothetical protein